MKRCIIFSAGTFYGLQRQPSPDDYVIAADAGYLACLVAGEKDSGLRLMKQI